MQQETVLRVTCKAPVNIATIKYWGKRDEVLMLPQNDSISVTLDTAEMCARTTIATSKDFTKDKMWLNGVEMPIENPRIQNCLREVRRRISNRKIIEKGIADWHVHICSENNFPTAAGLASSAAGYACLVYSLAKLYNLDSDLSEIARQGSGSACRSVFGGFVHWLKGEKPDGSDSIAYQIAPASHWPQLHLLIVVISDTRKFTSSTQGMQNSVNTSELFQRRIDCVIEKRVEKMLEAIKNKDFEMFAKITMQESNQLHAICCDTWPPISYLNDTSRSIITLIHQFNNFLGTTKVAYTFDAGANAFLFTLEPDIPLVASLIKHFFPTSNDDFFQGIPIKEQVELDKQFLNSTTVKIQPNLVKSVIHTKVGNGPETLTGSQEHLLDEFGLPNEKFFKLNQ